MFCKMWTEQNQPGTNWARINHNDATIDLEMSSPLCLFRLVHDFLWIGSHHQQKCCFYLPLGNKGGKEYFIFTEFHAIISPTQDLHSNLIDKIEIISYSIKPVTVFETYSPAHSGIAGNEEANRLANIGAKQAKKFQKEKKIKMAFAKCNTKSLSSQTRATKWVRQTGVRYQYVVP